MSNEPLTADEIYKLADDWYKALDVHVPQVDIMPMLATDGVEMVFPEATLTSLAEFEGWYQGVVRIFFDEVHTLKKVESKIDGTEAEVEVVVKWEASRWNPPAANSERLIMDAYQTWRVKRDPDSGKAVITYYRVDKLEPLPGSVPL
jgi:hypothetical protein